MNKLRLRGLLLSTVLVVGGGPALAFAEPNEPSLTAQTGAARSSAEDAAEQVFDDLTRYWAGAFPENFDEQFLALASGTSGLDSGAGGSGSLCVSEAEQILGNAYFCPQQDGIVYDTGVLVPVLQHRYGPGALAASLAHEFGHAIAARVGPTVTDRSKDPDRYPALYVELQADCYAGNYLRHLGVDLPPAVAPLLDFRDALTVQPSSATAHGLGLDRLQAVLAGWRSTPADCHDLELTDLDITLGRTGLSTRNLTPRFRSSAELLTALRKAAPDLTMPEALPTELAPVVGRLGQFAEATAHVLTAERALDDGPAAWCHTGAWVATTFGNTTGLGSWAGDADEALDLVRAAGPTTEELIAFVDGFTGLC